jgi:hypothetical protein
MARMTTSRYPIGTPVQPPQPRADQAAQLRFWALALLGAAALLLVVTVAGAVFWINLVRRGPAATPEGMSPSAAALAAAQARSGRLLDSLGGLSAGHLYQGFLNIGLLADGVEHKAYTRTEAEKLLGTVVELMNLVDRHLARLDKAGLDPEDLQAVERVRKLSGALRTQAEALRAYWASGDRAQAERYQALREEAWASLSELLEGQRP